MVDGAATIELDDSFARELTGLYQPWQPRHVAAPRLLALNTALADELGLDADFLASPAGVALLAGNAVPESARPLAQAYSGHQFGGFSPVLGDGRALLLGELIDIDGRRRDLHLKGSGPTPFARRGDGKAAVGPMLREYVIGEAMHALGIPTTRALAVVATGEPVHRGPTLPGAVLTRVAASHLRVGTFQYAAATEDRELLARLIDYAIARHHPAAADAPVPALGLLEAVVAAQARLVAEWMLVGFVHGVMNTDNTTISGETIDYGPCAFLDAHDPAAVFSSIDHDGRYAYGNQPAIMQWNLARLAESLLALVDDDREQAAAAATEVLGTYAERFTAAWADGVRGKLGLAPDAHSDPGTAATAGAQTDTGALGDAEAAALGNELITVMASERLDHTGTFRSLSQWLAGSTEPPAPLREWADRWQAAVLATGRPADAVAAGLDAVNPLYIPRNERVEEALDAATAGDLAPFARIVDVVTHPYLARPGLDEFAQPASPAFAATFQTFCGT